MSLPPFDWLAPRDLGEATHLLRGVRPGEVLILGGGTDLVPALKRRLHAPRALLSTRDLEELRRQEIGGEGAQLGAGVTLAWLAEDPAVRALYPGLTEAARQVGSPLVRASATLGGNLLLDTRCIWLNQSPAWRAPLGGCLKCGGARCHVAPGLGRCVAAWSGDLAGVLLAYRAQVEVIEDGARRILPLAQLYSGDGLSPVALAPGALLVSVMLPPPPPGHRVSWLKLRRRGSIDFSVLGVAASAEVAPGGAFDVTIRVVGAGPSPWPLEGVTARLERQGPVSSSLEVLVGRALSGVQLLPTCNTSVGWRRHMLGVMIQRAVARCLGLPDVVGAAESIDDLL